MESLSDTLKTWAALYSKKLDSHAVEKWVDLFVDTDARVLAAALDKLTREAERMPTPGMLTKTISLVVEQHPEWQPMQRLRYRSGRDTQGTACVFWSDDPSVPAYRAVDCPEGRKFLVEFARVSGKSRDQISKLLEKWSA